ncbi:MAG: cardiolipin synthase [Acidobacteria bacterium]|nr:cardiolipin synthase [Acidobacteriota bacterium]
MDLHTAIVVLEVIAIGALHAAVVVSILMGERRQPTATLAWLLTATLIPFAGALLYLLIGRTRTLGIVRRTKRAATLLHDIFEARGSRHWQPRPDGADLEPRTKTMLELSERLVSTPADDSRSGRRRRACLAHASYGNKVEMLVNGAAFYRSLFESIAAAERQLHVQFYIIQPDESGVSLRDRLTEAARNGLEVRVLYDAVGSSRLGSAFWKPLVDAGGIVSAFNPVSFLTSRLRRRDRIDFRNHRKLVIVDGKVGFTGGINIGREYLGLDPEVGHWRDTHLRIEGPAVLSLQEVFALDWNVACGESCEYASWFALPSVHPEGALVQVVDSGPDSEWAPVEQIYFQAISCAEEKLWLSTPYFVPSAPIEAALIAAAMRGVDVRLLVPHRPDSLVVGLASHSYFETLLRAGARVFLYEGFRRRRFGRRVRRGFLHAKTMVVDSWMATVGSANMDMRSFRLNFELNAFIYDTAFCDEMAAQFELDLNQASELTAEAARTTPYPRRMAQQAARVMSPLL